MLWTMCITVNRFVSHSENDNLVVAFHSKTFNIMFINFKVCTKSLNFVQLIQKWAKCRFSEP